MAQPDEYRQHSLCIQHMVSEKPDLSLAHHLRGSVLSHPPSQTAEAAALTEADRRVSYCRGIFYYMKFTDMVTIHNAQEYGSKLL